MKTRLSEFSSLELFKELEIRLRVAQLIKDEPVDDTIPEYNPETLTSSVPSGRSSDGGYPIVCSKCGQRSSVSFKPDPSRPVMCLDCYRRRND